MVTAQRNLHKASDYSDSLRRITWAAFVAVRTLSCSPCSPSATNVGLAELISDCERFCTGHPDHTINVYVVDLKDAVTEVLAHPSPVSDAVEAEVARFSYEQTGPWKGSPEAAIVVRPDLVESTAGFLREVDLTADVRAPAEVQREHHKALIICGSLSLAYSSQWLTRPEAARSFGWLITAPPGDEVTLVECDVSHNDLGSVWILGPRNHPGLVVASISSDPQVQEFAPLSFVQADKSRPLPSLDFSFSTEQKRDAFQILLASGRSIYFSPIEGPLPRRIVMDETGIESNSRTNPLHVHVNDLLIVRLTGSDHEEIAKRANDILTDGGWTSLMLDEVRSLVGLLKDKASAQSFEESRRRMVSAGLSESYARTVLRSIPGDWYIAPRRDHYEQVIRALGADELQGREDDLSQLRSAHQQAGKDIARELDSLLSSNYRWYDQLTIDGFALLEGGALGDLLVEAVLCQAEEGYRVPLSYLGRAVDGDPPRPVTVALLRRNQ
jgi:hypothetical protein